MRFSLLDLLIGMVTSALGTLAASLLARFSGVEGFILLFGLPLTLLAYLLITPFVYQHFHLRPLLLPRCPHCKDKNRHFWFEKHKADWPRDVIVCAICQATLELWYESPQNTEVSTTMSSYRLMWPQSWGRWRLIFDRNSTDYK